MAFPTDQIDELKLIATTVAACEEGGINYIHLSNVQMPAGCVPTSSDVVLCPVLQGGYNSRIFFPQKIASAPTAAVKALNWNGSTRIAEKNWVAFSWRTPAGLRLAQMVSIHLKALQ